VWHDIRLLNGLANVLLGLVLMSFLASGVWWLAQRPMFTLGLIRIESGTAAPLRHVSDLIIRTNTLPKLRGNFFTADLDNVRQVFESVPWVRRASVRREWPNHLIVALEEHEALGTWGDDEGRLLSVKGELFTVNLAEAEEDAHLPQFNGPKGSEKEVLTHYLQLRQWLAPIKLAPETLTLSGRYAWSMKLDNGLGVELGREENNSTLKERVGRLVQAYPQLMVMLQGEMESVDLRYPNGLALKSKNVNADIAARDNAKLKTGRKK
jgi:cell division protein FtsQ